MGKSTVSVRERQQNLKRVMARVERGEVVEVTASPAGGASHAGEANWTAVGLA